MCASRMERGAARFNVNQQSGSSYSLSLLKREFAGVDYMHKASFITSSMVWLEFCRVLVPLQSQLNVDGVVQAPTKNVRKSLACRSGIIYIGENDMHQIESCAPNDTHQIDSRASYAHVTQVSLNMM